MTNPERQIEESLIAKLSDLKYGYRSDIRDRAALEANFREKFEALNRVTLTDGEFERLLDEIVTPDVYRAARVLRHRETFIRDDGTPLNYTPDSLTGAEPGRDWCSGGGFSVGAMGNWRDCLRRRVRSGRFTGRRRVLPFGGRAGGSGPAGLDR